MLAAGVVNPQGLVMDRMFDDVVLRTMSFFDTPEMAVSFAAVSKRYKQLELRSEYKYMSADAVNDGSYRWICRNINRIQSLSLRTKPAVLRYVIPVPRLPDDSQLFHEIHGNLVRTGNRAVKLLKLYGEARVSGKDKKIVKALEQTILYDCGFEVDYFEDEASFAWDVDDVINTGSNGQISVCLHLWQPLAGGNCGFQLEVRRGSNNHLFTRTSSAYANEYTTDWRAVAVQLYEEVSEFEHRKLEPADADDDSDEGDEDEDDYTDDDDDSAEFDDDDDDRDSDGDVSLDGGF